MDKASCTLALVLPALLSACAVQGTAPRTGPSARVGEAVTAPLADLNLLRTKIPPALIEAKKAPYLQPAVSDCESLISEVHQLNEALGPDLDNHSPEDDTSLMERGATEAGDAVIGAIKSASVGWIPYRGWVRKLTGAERHSKEVASAIKAGLVRRAFLKGLGLARECTFTVETINETARDTVAPPN